MRSNYRKLFNSTAAALFLLTSAGVSGQVLAAEPQSAVVAPSITAPAKPEQSVLERFRLFVGERTPERLSALFDATESPVVRQQPRIALSDGSTAVILAIKLAAVDGRAPNFSLRSATLLDLQQKGNSEWVLKALPAKGTLDAALVVAVGATVREYPLTVSAALPADAKLTLLDFNDFAGKPAGACAKESDLNADGVCDYRDDYIYTANYLVRESSTGRSKDARRQRALQRTLTVAPPAKPAEPVSGVVTDPNFTP